MGLNDNLSRKITAYLIRTRVLLNIFSLSPLFHWLDCILDKLPDNKKKTIVWWQHTRINYKKGYGTDSMTITHYSYTWQQTNHIDNKILKIILSLAAYIIREFSSIMLPLYIFLLHSMREYNQSVDLLFWYHIRIIWKFY